MTGSQPIQYSFVEFRKNPARPSDGWLLLGLVFAFSSEEVSALGWRWRAGIPAAQLEQLDPLSRELFEHRKSTLKSELDAAMQNANLPTDVLAQLALRNPWSFHVGTPVTADVEPFDRTNIALEDWIEGWTARIFEERAAAADSSEAKRRRPARGRTQTVEAVSTDAAATWLEMPRLINRVMREPLPA